MEQVNIISIENHTHNVVHIKTEKPDNITFVPGQAADVAIDKSSWKQEVRPFTFASLPTDNHLEFYIKIYPEHKGVTEQIGKLKKDNGLFIGDVFGDINYKGEGIFIAGGAGITPFISIFKDLEKQDKVGNNKLIFANKTYNDIIDREFFEILLGKNFINVLSGEEKKGFEHGYITKSLIESHMENSDINFYLCGPPPMMDAVLKELKDLGIEESKIVKEEY